MTKRKIPDWLIATQNKSWEPEILISGITLTSLFILSSHIYNFYGMLIQDFGVTYAIPKALYIISIIILTGLKIILIIHLILRGIWTGFVGLSYVFPNGVRREKLPKTDRNVRFDKPETVVIKLERVCSLLFSFIFSSIAIFLSFFVLYIPIILLFMSGLDRDVIQTVSLIFVAAVVVGVIVVGSLLKTRLKKSKLKQRLGNNLYSFTRNMYFTNVGKIKTYLIFALYFLLVVSLSFSDFKKFEFKNDTESPSSEKAGITQLHNDHYEALRNKKLRISKAAINRFHLTGDRLELFVSLYKNDADAVQNIKKTPVLLEPHDMTPASSEPTLPDLYRIQIDGQPVSGLKWYEIDNRHTGQRGIFTTIPLSGLNSGYHELRLDKLIWRFKKKKLEFIKNWLTIPFELDRYKNIFGPYRP